MAEVRRLFNAARQRRRSIPDALSWSFFRRRHQADARKYHYRRRLKTQRLAL